MNEDKLKALKNLEAPPPSSTARAKALTAAMAAFDAAQKENPEAPQGNAGPARLTLASTQTQRRRWMRASSIQYKIAASIGVLILATPMALHLWREEKPAPASSEAIRSTPNHDAVTTFSKRDPQFPANEKAVYDRLAPDGSAQPASASTSAGQAPHASSLEDRIDEALRKAQESGQTGAGQPTIVHSEEYRRDGTRVESRPVITPNIASADKGLPYPFGNATPPAPAAPQMAAASAPSGVTQDGSAGSPGSGHSTPPAQVAGSPVWNSPIGPLRADFGALQRQPAQTEVFRFGAATSFGGGAPASQPAPADKTYPPAQHAGTGDVLMDTRANRNRLTQNGAPLGDMAGVSGDVNYAGNLPEPLPAEEIKENRDQFEAFVSNAVKQVAAEPVSTFSIDVDTASYGFIRRSLMAGRMPPKDAVRVEEMINYFPYAYPRPESAAVPFQPTVTVTPSPWKPTNKLVHIGIKGYDIAAKERPRANLVFLIDVSGSMAPEDRLPLLKNAFRMLLDELKPDDTVGIVTYASHSGVALEPTRVAERGKIADILSQLHAGGSTAGGEGLQNAYKLAEMHFDKTAVNRIILATDGDFNVGISDREQLKRFIEGKRQTGIYLSVIGVGQDNYNDRLMQTLAQNGNGVAAYVDTLNEARKVLVDEASSTLFTIAKDVKIQIEFNPAQVSEYRLIGYETRALKREDFNNDKVDAGEIGSGHTVTAIYEVTPVGAPKTMDDLRYRQKPEMRPEIEPAVMLHTGNGELAYLKIRYKLPGEDESKLIALPVAPNQETADIQAVPEDVRFSIAVAAFGQLLRGEPYTGIYNFDSVLALAQSARGPDPFGYRAEFLNLVRLAKSTRH
jgi:Ca-activated chloride channel homolog